MRGLRRAQLQAAALGVSLPDSSAGTYEASGISPPSYWETVEQDTSVPGTAPVASGQNETRSPPNGNFRYTRLENAE